MPSGFSLLRFAIYPQADVLVIIGWEIQTMNEAIIPQHPWVYLWSMTTGRPHPDAQLTSFRWPTTDDRAGVHSISITNSRLAMITGPIFNPWVVIWDWRTGQILLVSERLASITGLVSTGFGTVG